MIPQRQKGVFKIKCKNSSDFEKVLYDQLVQTGSQEIWLAKSQSVNFIQPGKSHTSMGCPAPMFAESVYRVNTTNKLKQCGSRKVLQRDY